MIAENPHALHSEITDEHREKWQALAEKAEDAKTPDTEVQSEFDALMASLPANFRIGLSKIVDVRNLTAEQLRGLLIANSIDGMDEVIRAAQYGDPETAINSREIGHGHANRMPWQHADKGDLGTYPPGTETALPGHGKDKTRDR